MKHAQTIFVTPARASLWDSLALQEALMTVGIAALSSLWTFFKSSEWWARRREKKWSRLLLVIEAAVAETYRNYVRDEKAATGMLSDGVREAARDAARRTAHNLARSAGMRLEDWTSAPELDALIERAVQVRKGARSG